MPKLKTCRGAAKRFKVTKRGKVKAKKINLRHILTTKNPKRKRHLRKAAIMEGMNQRRVRKMLPYS